jgi:hypothetical protein
MRETASFTCQSRGTSEDFNARARSEMIVDAFQIVKGQAAVSELTLAMGLRSAEAKRLRH